MKLILRAATIIQPGNPFHNKVVDVRITDGVISEIGTDLDAQQGFEEIVLENLHLSEGWFDSSVSFGEPGFEERETIANGLRVAAKSGFTAVALQPNVYPVTDNQAQLQFVRSKAGGSAVSLYPIGALTKESLGKDLAEMYDMKNAGAIAFGDYNKAVANPNLLKIALQYVQDFDALVIAFCEDSDIKGSGTVHEGIVSTRLGLKGIPALAEELQLARNLALLEYTGGKMHIPTLSSAGSVRLIKQAKSKGLRVSCSVSVAHLLLNDEVLEGFDTRYKLCPPLRSETDRLALIEAVKDGTIDMITTDHNPIDIEHKKVEFDLAKNGSIGLESAFGALQTVLPIETIIAKFTSGKAVFGIPNASIAAGEQANLTLFNPDISATFGSENIFSKSKNSAFLGMELKGKTYGIINNNKLEI